MDYLGMLAIYLPSPNSRISGKLENYHCKAVKLGDYIGSYVELISLAGQYIGQAPISDVFKLDSNGKLSNKTKLEVWRRIKIITGLKYDYTEGKRPLESIEKQPKKVADKPKPTKFVSYKTENSSFRQVSSPFREAMAMKRMRKLGPASRLGKAQTREKHKKQQAIGDDIALAHLAASIGDSCNKIVEKINS